MLRFTGSPPSTGGVLKSDVAPCRLVLVTGVLALALEALRACIGIECDGARCCVDREGVVRGISNDSLAFG